MEKQAASVVSYYVLCNKLKHVIRSGWKVWNVKRERLESIAEHVYGVQQLAIIMWSEYGYDIDISRVLFMLAIHELEETVIGDLTLWDVSIEEKLSQGHQAVQMILRDVLRQDQIQSLIFEFDERKTEEARFAFYCDKLECDIQAKLYGEEDCVDLSDQEGNVVFHDELVQRLLNEGRDWSSMCLAFSREKYGYDPHFTEVSCYVEKTQIGKVKLKKES